MAQGVHLITEEFERVVSDYTGAPYCVAVDNASNALFLALTFSNVKGQNIMVPNHTYPSVPCEVIHAGAKVLFYNSVNPLSGAYYLNPTKVVDSALRFTADMYEAGSLMCVSFTGAYKHLKLSKGGAILTDNFEAVKWLKKARFSGRDECSYNEDDFDVNPVIGWNMYMMPELAARGLLLMAEFYNPDGSKKDTEDKTISYPDLSTFKLWQ